MEYALIALAVFLGATVSGFSGFAFSAVAGAILLHVFDAQTAVPLMMACSVVSQASTLVVLRKFIAWREAALLIAGGIVAVPIAVHILTNIDSRIFRFGFGAFLIVYSIYMLAKRASVLFVDASPLSHSMVGFAGGLVGGLTGMPGALPAIWCELRGICREHQRGVVQPFILAMQIFSILTFAAISQTPLVPLAQSVVIALPALAAGTAAGMAMFSRIDAAGWRRAVLFLLLGSGLLMLR